MKASCQVDDTFTTEGKVALERLIGLATAILAVSHPDSSCAAVIGSEAGRAHHWSDPALEGDSAAMMASLVAAAKPGSTEPGKRSEILIGVAPEGSTTLRAADAIWLSGIAGALAAELAALREEGLPALDRYPVPSPYDLPGHHSLDALGLMRESLG